MLENELNKCLKNTKDWNTEVFFPVFCIIYASVSSQKQISFLRWPFKALVEKDAGYGPPLLMKFSIFFL
jgi:hypothetical protein